MNADASAPATRSPKIASGILNAAMNASRSGEPPNVAPSTDSRSQPRTRLATSVPIMIADARATDIGTALILRHPLSCAADGNKETQALGPQAHPADAAPHHRQDDRPLRGAEARAPLVYRSDGDEVGLAGELDELGCELRRLQQEARCRGEVLHQVPRVARAERDVALAAVRRDPIRGLRVESDLLLLADAAQDLGELLVRGRLDLDLVLDAPQERLVDEG